jgi:hypothetical protein
MGKGRSKVSFALLFVAALALAACTTTPSAQTKSASKRLHQASTGITTTTATSRVPVLVTTALALVNCPTSYGVTGQAGKVLPATVDESVPSSLASGLAVYTDGLNLIQIIAPTGWKCSAQVGADGSSGLEVYPASDTEVPSNYTEKWNPDDEALVGSQTSACSNCGTGQACPYFASANTAWVTNNGRPCPGARPPRESVEQLSARAIGFEDPPGVAGAGEPSGGLYPANGVMTYLSPTTYNETCTLPQSQHDICTASLNVFAAVYQNPELSS